MKILLIADSVVGGFGNPEKKSFVHYALKEHEIVDLSCPGMTTEDFLNYIYHDVRGCKEQTISFQEIKNIDLCILSLGNVDGKKVIKKNNFFSKLIPNRYFTSFQDERPYYSKKRIKKILQKAENQIRRFFKIYARWTMNYEYPVPFNDYQTNINQIIELIPADKFMLISTSLIDDHFFHGANFYFDKVNLFLKSLKKKSTSFYDFRSIIKNEDLLCDRFHITLEGQKSISHYFKRFFKQTQY